MRWTGDDGTGVRLPMLPKQKHMQRKRLRVVVALMDSSQVEGEDAAVEIEVEG